MTIRGIAHWRMAERFGLMKANRPDLSRMMGNEYGQGKVNASRLQGKPLVGEEERRAIFSHMPGRHLEGHFLRTGRAGRLREAGRLAKVAVDNPALTVEVLQDLCRDLGRSGCGTDDARNDKFVHDWLRKRGFLR